MKPQPKINIGGRPPKYAGPSRPVTVTLPEKTLNDLLLIDSDRGRAIVKLAKDAVHGPGKSDGQVELVAMTPDAAMIVVGPSDALRTIHFLRLIEVAPGRFLLALLPGHGVAALELAIRDLLEISSDDSGRDHVLLTQLLTHLRNLRTTDGGSIAEVLFVNGS